MRPNGVCLSVHPSVQAQNMCLEKWKKGTWKSARLVLWLSSVKCCLNEARGTENPDPESKVRIMPGECWWRCQGWGGGGGAAHCAL